MGIPKGGIAFFDSGIGGLTVLDACRKFFPNEIFYYYGDNRHAPYGNLSIKKISRYVHRAFKRFQRLHVWAAVVACNTVTAVCIEELRKKFSFPIIGTEPAVLSAAKNGGEIFVLVTRATYESVRFKKLCEYSSQLFSNSTIRSFACDNLAGEIEKHIVEQDADFTPCLPKGNPKSVVLGCTHYVYITKQIADFYDCEVFNGNRGIAKRLYNILIGNELTQPSIDTSQPLDGENRFLKPQKTTFAPSKKKKRKVKNGRRFRKKKLSTSGEKRLFFMGSGGKYNKKIYEQMFVL